MDLSTTYLGLNLPNPLLAGSSPLADDVGVARQLEDAGAAAIVMRSLFEEQLLIEATGLEEAVARTESVYAESLSFFPKTTEYKLGPDEYLEQLRRIKAAVKLPVIASLNGVTAKGWPVFAKQIAQAGADALELNVYYLATNPQEDGRAVEKRTVDVVKAVRKAVPKLPLAVKLSPFYSSIANMAAKIEAAGAQGLIIFNRFYQPDFDLENLEVAPTLKLSDPSELLLRLRWLAILHGQVKLSLCASGGVHSAQDILKAVMAGADATQVVSAVLRRGPEAIRELRQALSQWLEQHNYQSLKQAHGSLSLEKCPDRSAYERANYQKLLQSWR